MPARSVFSGRHEACTRWRAAQSAALAIGRGRYRRRRRVPSRAVRKGHRRNAAISGTAAKNKVEAAEPSRQLHMRCERSAVHEIERFPPVACPKMNLGGRHVPVVAVDDREGISGRHARAGPFGVFDPRMFRHRAIVDSDWRSDVRSVVGVGGQRVREKGGYGGHNSPQESFQIQPFGCDSGCWRTSERTSRNRTRRRDVTVAQRSGHRPIDIEPPAAFIRIANIVGGRTQQLFHQRG
jgi:hypothetical protein